MGRFFPVAFGDVPFEYVSPTWIPHRAFYCTASLLSTFLALQTSFPVHVIMAWSVVASFGFATTTIPVKRYPLFAETMSFLGFNLVLLFGHFTVFVFATELGRQRSAAIMMLLSKHIPQWFGFRCVPCILYLVVSLLFDCTNGYLIMLHHGDPWTIMNVTNYILWTCIYTALSFVQLSWIARMYTVENDLKAEKSAMEQLLSLLCDCHVLIHGNGDTVLRSNPIFDSLTGEAMEATQLSDGTWFSADDAERLRDAFDRACNTPLILPISIRGESSYHHDVDLLIVSRGKNHTTTSRNNKTDYGGGANRSDEKTVSSFLVGMRITNLRIADQATLGRSSSEDNANTLESATANESNGQIDLKNIEATACKHDDHIDNRSIASSLTVTGLAFESLSTALTSGDRDSVNRCLKRIIAMGRAEKWLVPLTGVTLFPRSILGSGGFGIVICGKVFGTDVAVKLVRTSDSNVQKQLPSLLNELRVLRRFHHPSVVQFFGACLDVDNVEIGLIFEKVSGICLDHFVRSSPNTQEDANTRCALLYDIAGALRFLHAQEPSIVHSDLKPSNVMVESRGWESGICPKAKILDFGLAKFATRSAHAIGGSLHWMAPEMLKDAKIPLKPSLDVYSFGRLLFFLNTGKQPLEGVSRRVILYLARLGTEDPIEWPHGVEPFAQDTKDLLARCVSGHARNRPPMEQVHNRILQWTTHHTRTAALFYEEETSWVEGLKIARAVENLPPPVHIQL